MSSRAGSVLLALLLLPAAARSEGAPGAGDTDRGASYPERAAIGSALPGTWRPFSDESPWNAPIADGTLTHPDNEAIMATIVAEARRLRLANRYTVPLWVVNADRLPQLVAVSPYPFDAWDQDLDGVTEARVPISPAMFGESTSDGHISIVDPVRMLAWEMSRFQGIHDGVIRCSTFNIWDLEGTGVGDGDEGYRWKTRGGRGSGFPIIAGLIRPEALREGEIRHALVFMFPKNRKGLYLPPASRSDGDYEGAQYPLEGMRMQLDPTLTDRDFDRWGLNREGRIVARALQRYGMFNGDNGGAMALQPQLLDPDPDVHRAKWDALFPGFYDNVTRIPTAAFRIVYTGEPVRGGGRSTVVAPMITPLGGVVSGEQNVRISTPTRGARITYTTDGSIPTESSERYEDPLAIDTTVTVRARAFKAGMKASSVTRAPFREAAAGSP